MHYQQSQLIKRRPSLFLWMLHHGFANAIQVSVEVEEHENGPDYLTPTYFERSLQTTELCNIVRRFHIALKVYTIVPLRLPH